MSGTFETIRCTLAQCVRDPDYYALLVKVREHVSLEILRLTFAEPVPSPFPPTEEDGK